LTVGMLRLRVLFLVVYRRMAGGARGSHRTGWAW
jgi:hypothetical protein